jgi:YT521-B-like domain
MVMLGLPRCFFTIWILLIINRMAGPIRRGGQSIHWTPSPPRSNQSPASSSRFSQDHIFFSPGDHRLVDSSPLSVDNLHTPTDSDRAPHNQSAPGMLGMKYSLPSMKTPEMKFSLDQQQTRPPQPKNPPSAQKDDFELDPLAPVRAMRSSGGKSGSSLQSLEEITEETGANVQEPTISHQQEVKGEEELWGNCFEVEWISTEKMPFSRTRQFRNPWNHDREVKVSRDGTELEPTVGQKLLDEWHIAEAQPF